MTPKTGTGNYWKICKAVLTLATFSLVTATHLYAATSVAASGQACLPSSGSWANASLPQTETASFRVTFDATPSAATMDAVSGLSSAAASAFTSLAAAAHFSSSGVIDVRNGSGFTAATRVLYAARVKYHFIFDVNISAHTYNASVLVGTVQATLGTNLAFRTEQATVKSLNNVGVLSSRGALSICNITLSTSPAATMLLNASTTSLSFGQVRVSDSSNQNITLTNAGNSNVTLSKVSLSGAGFNASGGAAGLILSPKQSTTVRATFAPSATGTQAGAITVSSNANNSPANIALSGIGIAMVDHSVKLSWNSNDSGLAGYNVYTSSTSGGPYSRLNTASVPGTTYVDTTVQTGRTYYYVVTAVSSGNKESGHSTEVNAVIP